MGIFSSAMCHYVVDFVGTPRGRPAWPAGIPLENHELPPQGENFKCAVATSAEEYLDCRQD